MYPIISSQARFKIQETTIKNYTSLTYLSSYIRLNTFTIVMKFSRTSEKFTEFCFKFQICFSKFVFHNKSKAHICCCASEFTIQWLIHILLRSFIYEIAHYFFSYITKSEMSITFFPHLTRSDKIYFRFPEKIS